MSNSGSEDPRTLELGLVLPSRISILPLGLDRLRFSGTFGGGLRPCPVPSRRITTPLL